MPKVQLNRLKGFISYLLCNHIYSLKKFFNVFQCKYLSSHASCWTFRESIIIMSLIYPKISFIHEKNDFAKRSKILLIDIDLKIISLDHRSNFKNLNWLLEIKFFCSIAHYFFLVFNVIILMIQHNYF